MTLRNRHGKSFSLQPQLHLEVLEQRYVLSANIGLASLAGATSAPVDTPANENSAVVSSKTIAECTNAITPPRPTSDDSASSENTAAPAVITGEAQPISWGTVSSPTEAAGGSDGLVVAPVKDVAPASDDGPSQPERAQTTVDECTLGIHIRENLLAATGTEPSTDATDAGSTDTTKTDPTAPVVCTFGGVNASTTTGETASPTTLHPTNGGTDDSTGDTTNDPPETLIYYNLHDPIPLEPGATNDPPETVIYYNLHDPIPLAPEASLTRKDVKHIAREIKHGHDVDLNVDALMQLHSATKKNTRKLIERIIVTTHEVNHSPSPPTVAPSSKVQAIDQAFAGLGTATAKIKSFKRR